MRAVAWALGLLLAVGCRCRPPAEPRDVLVLGTLEEPDSLDPLFTELAGAQEIVRLISRDLVDYDERWATVPALAEGPPVVETSSSGGVRATWTLRAGMAWSSGSAIEAEDVAFAFRLAKDPALAVTALRPPPELARVEVLSKTRFTAVWRAPVAYLAAPRTHAILPRTDYPTPAAGGGPFRGRPRDPVASGPYRLARWSPGQELELEVNPRWSGPPPAIPRLRWRFYKSEDALALAVETGVVQALGEASGFSVERGAELARRLSATHQAYFTESGLFLQLALRLDDPRLADVRARRALSLALDRTELARLVYGGQAEPAGSCFPPRHRAFVRGSTPADPAAAERLWDELGYLRRGPGQERRRGDEPLRFTLQVAAGSAASERAASVVAASLGRIGVGVEIEALPLKILFAKMRDRTHAPLALFAWRSGPDWDGFAAFHSTGRQNYGGYRDPEADRLLEAARVEVDTGRWSTHLMRFGEKYSRDLPTVPLLFRRAFSLAPRDLQGWRPTGTTTPVTWNAEQWTYPAR